MAHLLSIIIVNYNGLKFLRECLLSIAEHAACPHEVIIVDNASTDGSREYLREHFPEVTLVTSEKNLGFAGGNNLGAAHAKGDLLLLLNNDARLMSSLMPAIRAFETDEQLGVLGCRMSYSDDRLQPSIGFEATPLRLVLSWVGIGRFKFAPAIFKRVDNDACHYLSTREAAWVSGAFLMTRQELWGRLGGLDERYFMYIEDVDYCKRTRMAGYRVAYTPNVKIIHYEGGGKLWVGERALTDSMKSYIIYLKKYHNKYAELFVRFILGSVMAARALIYGIESLIISSALYKEKKEGYLRASLFLMRIGE
ncbi:MAG: glycosyltransferase family 2 protein [Nitrospirae bacterium]|nr:glycosyltransferase family 2 protein [Nitrospirota bacterium]